VHVPYSKESSALTIDCGFCKNKPPSPVVYLTPPLDSKVSVPTIE